MEEFIGKICPYCKAEIKEGDEVKVCPECGIPHHAACWEENKGCATSGCKAQHCEEQHASSDETCSNCGAPLEKGQAFCSKCGQKQDVILQSATNSAIAEFNKQVENASKKKEKNKKLKISLCVLISLLLVGAALFGYFEFYLISGSYIYVSSKSNSTYTFDDGKYTYNSGDSESETKTGSYKLKIGEVDLFDEDNDKTTLGRMGKYLYSTASNFEEKFDKQSKSDQVFSKAVSSATSSGDLLSFDSKLQLGSNGTYKYNIEMSATITYTDYEYEYYGYYLGYMRVPVTRTKVISDDVIDEHGTYEVSGNKLILKPDGEKEKIFLIRDGYIYYSVYEKSK